MPPPKPLTIAFDAKRLFYNPTGLGVYARTLVQNLADFYPHNHYVLCSPSIPPGTQNPFQSMDTISAPSSVPNALWRSWFITKELQKKKPHIYHGLSNEIPFNIDPNLAYITTVHDVIWLKFPQYYNAIDRYIYTLKLKHAIKYSRHIIATSKQTQSDLIDLFRVPKEQISVLYQSIPTQVAADSKPPKESLKPYFVYVSSFQERKNHKPLLQIYARISAQTPYNLVLIGRPGSTLQDVQNTIKALQIQDRVTVLTDVSETEKEAWIQHAAAFVYASEYEGFGIPLLEAAQYQIPLILNQTPVFKELAQDCATYFSIHNPEQAAETLLNFNAEHAHNKALAMTQRFRELFSPMQTSHKLIELYHAIVSNES